MALKNKQNRTIVLSFTEEMYCSFMEHPEIAHEVIQQQLFEHPELFPLEIEKGYMLNGKTRVSKKFYAIALTSLLQLTSITQIASIA